MLLPKHGMFEKQFTYLVFTRIEEAKNSGLSEITVLADEVDGSAGFSKNVIEKVKEVYPDLEVSGYTKEITLSNF